MAVHIQLRRDTSGTWLSANPVLLPGEFGVETDTGKFKIGNGVTAWSALAYAGGDDAALTAHSTDSTNVHGIANTADLATKAYADQAASAAAAAIIDAAPGTLNTLNEIAAAIGNNADFATYVQQSLAQKAPTASPSFTGYSDFAGVVDFTDSTVVGIDALPSQSGNSGKYLTTNGTAASWHDIPAVTPHPFSMLG